ncbi:MAG: SIMPL domain-containing protein [Candidatus Nealsonbacteria bacterium]|nr:SIMPL domain-containing protein [Candidatus Nealsonbacteria bacterium]
MENKTEKMCCDYKKCMPAAAYLLTAFIAVLMLFFAVGIFNKIKEGRYIGQNSAYKNTISVTATGDVYAKPDLAQVSFSVVNNNKTAVEAMSENANKMNAVIDFIKKQGIEDKDLKTTNFSINPRYEWRKNGERVFIDYEVSQSLDVKIRDLNKIGAIIEGAAGNGANQAGSLYFTIDDQDKINAEARQKAISEAKIKAQDLVSELGVKLGKIVNFSESGYNPIPMYAFKEMGMGGGGTTPQIETGENKISVTVSITYEIR